MTQCLIECTAIPDGFFSSSLLRLSVLLRPETLPAKTDARDVQVPLARWPSELPTLEFQVWAGPNVQSMVLTETISAAAAFEGKHTPDITPKAQRWWEGLWRGSDLDYYLDLLNGEGSAAVGKAKVKSYDYEKLHETAITESIHELQRAWISHEVRRMAADKESPIDLEREFSGFTLRAARDPNDPHIRIARELARARLGAIATSRQATILGRAPMGRPSGSTRAMLVGRGTDGVLDKEFAEALDPENFALPFGLVNTKSYDAVALATTYDEFEEVMKTDEELGADSKPLEPKYDQAHKMLGMLQAHPALRKFARQIADVNLDVEKLRTACGSSITDFQGFIAVLVKKPGEDGYGKLPDVAMKTAFEVRTSKDPIFEPCPRSTFIASTNAEKASASASLPLRDGFVFNQTIDGKRRFRIASIDGIAAYFSGMRAHQSTIGSYDSGAATKDVPTEPQGFRTRGLMLLDTMVKEAAEAAEHRVEQVEADHILFAEDLVDGFRIDVVAPDGRVFPACARKVRYEAFDSLTVDQQLLYDTERNDGSVSPLGRTWSKGAQTYLAVSQVIFTWSGANFGLPGANTEDGIQYDFDPQRLGAILRNLRHYRFMIRARKLNGSSRPLSNTRLDEFALGSELDKMPYSTIEKGKGDRGYQFAFVEKAPAPTILVDGGFRPQTGPDPDDRETVNTIFVSTGDSSPKVRWLVSPIKGFDLGEQQGQFDPRSSLPADRDRAQRASRTGAYTYLKHQENGGFPPVMDGKMLLGQGFEVIPPGSTLAGSPHYVDATLRTIAARLTAAKGTPTEALGSDLLTSDAAFFPATKDVREFDPDTVVPVRLEVTASGSSKRSRIYNGPDFELRLPGHDRRRLRVPTIRVEVAAGDTLELEIWANRTSDAFRANPAVAFIQSAKSRLSVLLTPDEKSDQAFYEFTRAQRVASLSDVIRLRIEHPVNRPLARPDVVAPLQIFRARDLEAWRKIVENSNGIDEADASKVFPTGRIALDRKTTGEIWAEAFWKESEALIVRTEKDEMPGRVNQEGLYRRQWPVQFKRLFSISDLPLPAKLKEESPDAYLERINEIDLLLADPDPNAGPDHGRVARGLTADFVCDRQRTFAVRIVARSRFAPSNSNVDSDQPQPAAANEAPEDDAFTQASATRSACHSAISTLADPEAAAWSPGVFRISVPATLRPTPPYPTRDKGTVYHRKVRSDGLGSTVSYTYRVWFEGNWGDERLAIICRRPRSAKLEGWADAKLSRWGGDMAAAPGQELRIATDLAAEDASYLVAGQIEGADEKVATLWQEDSDRTAEVSLACLKPEFHDGFGRFYCDVELKPTGAFKAGLRLMIARYEENAISGRQLSSVIPIDTVMLPQPWHFVASRRERDVQVTVTGPAYQGHAPMLETLAGISRETTMRMLSNLTGDVSSIDIPSLVQTPLIVAELERLDADGRGPMPVFDGGQLVIASNLQRSPENVIEHVNGLSQPLQLKRWHMSLPIPEEDRNKRLSVRASLASAHANSHARLARTIKPETGFQPSALDGPLIFLPEPIGIELEV